MSAPRLEIDLDKIEHNARTLVDRLAARGISVTGVTKAALGSPQIAGVLLQAGVSAIGDSRIENLEQLRRARISAWMILVRSPMLSEVERVVTHADASCNSELAVLQALSAAACRQQRTHGVVLMVELGDLREGVMPADLERIVLETLALPNLALAGIGTNLACQSGVAPSAANMGELSAIADSIETTFGISLDIVSGGNSGNLDWALGDAAVGRVNDLRLGEAILLGLEPLHRRPIDGLHTDAFRLAAEVIESQVKPTEPWGDVAQTAFVQSPPPRAADADRTGHARRTILALGHQDVDPAGLVPPPGMTILGASSDHVVLDTGRRQLDVGQEVAFGLNYSALVRAMTSPFVGKVIKVQSGRAPTPATHGGR